MQSGDSISVDIDAELLDDGNSLSGMDSYLRLFDASAVELIANDNDFGPNDYYFTSNDAYLTFTASASGNYYVGVSSAGNDWYDPTIQGSGTGYTTGDYVLQILRTSGGGSNQAPTASDDSYSVAQGNTLTVAAAGVLSNDSDPDSDPLTASLQAGPSNGTLSYLNANGSFQYVPNAGFLGTDSFTYLASDGTANSNEATVSISVLPQSDPPLISAGQIFEITEDALSGTTIGTVAATDDNGVLHSWTIETGNQDGAFALDSQSGVLTVASAAGLRNGTAGTYHLTISVSDGVNTASQLVHVTVSPVSPAIVVTADHDVIDPNDGVTTLREAIMLANAQPGRDAIEFGLPSANRVIRLAQPDPVTITSALAIKGPAGGLVPTITLPETNPPSTRLFTVTATGDVSLTDIVLSAGASPDDGGAILNAGNLRLNRVTVRGSTAEGRGAGIFNAANGHVVITNSTIAANQATDEGGGIYNADGGLLTILNSTISGNASDLSGGGVHDAGGATAVNVTIANNESVSGAGVQAAGTTTLLNTIVANNSGSPDISGILVSAGHNLVGDASAASGLSAVKGDQFGDALCPVDPRLGPLQQNGGATETHQLLVGSPAIDAGSNLVASVIDQRGAPRNLDGLDPNDPMDSIATVDVGAFEFGAFFVNVDLDQVDTTPLADGTVDTDPSLPGDQISLRSAVQELNALAGWNGMQPATAYPFDAHILIPGGVSVLHLTLNGLGEDASATGDLDVFGDLTIRGEVDSQHNNVTTLHAAGTTSGFTDRMFHVLPAATLRVERLSVTGGFLLDDGSSDSLRGAVVLNDGGNLEVTDSLLSFSDDTDSVGEADQGGAIYTRGGSLLVQGSELIRNFAKDGGGVYIESGDVVIRNSEISWGGAGIRGGGVFVESGNVLVDHSQITHNYSDNRAAGLYNLNGIVRVTGNSEISYNGFTAPLGVEGGDTIGGAFFNVGQLTIDAGSRIENNEAVRGGAVYNQGLLTILDSTISQNMAAPREGGAIANVSSGVVVIERSRLVNNEAAQGNVIFNDNGKVTLIESEILQDFYGFTGYHIYNYDLDAELTIVDSDITGTGGGDFNIANSLFNLHGTVNIFGSAFYESFNTPTYTASEGSVITNLGEYRYLGGTPDHFITLAASVNDWQQIVYITDATVVEDLPLPFHVRIGDEEMAVTGVDYFQDALLVERAAPTVHAVTEDVRVVITETQRQFPIANPEVLSRYRLPLDVVIDHEVMTIVSVEDGLATVERGRRDSIPAKHVEPVSLWGLSGALTIADTTFVETHVNELDGTGAVLNHVNPFVQPTIIDGSTFSGHQIVDGSVYTDITTDFYWPGRYEFDNPQSRYLVPLAGERDIFPGLGTPATGWRPNVAPGIASNVNLPEDSLYIRNTVFESAGPQSSTTFSLGLTDRYFFEPQYPINPQQTVIPALARDYPAVPFNIVVSHLDEEGQVANEVMTVTLVARDQNGNPAFGVERGPAPIWHTGELSISYPRNRDLPTGRFVSGGGNYLNADYVTFATTIDAQDLDATQTTVDIVLPRQGLPPTLPFLMRVSDGRDIGTFEESMLVTAVEQIAGGARLTVTRGVGKTTPIAHQKPLIMFSRSGFW